jgi:hypothetical protein
MVSVIRSWTGFLFVVLFVTYSIACYDIYMTIKHSEYILEMEQNPVAKFLIKKWGVEGFVAAKCFVTVVATQFITIVYLLREVKHKYKIMLEWLLALWFAEQMVTWYILTQ